MAKRALKWVGIVLGAAVLAAAGLVGWLTVREYKPAAVEDVEISRTGAPKTVVLSPGDSLTLMSKNTGYDGLGADSDFFMDGGKDVAPNRAQKNANLTGISDIMEETMAAVYFF